MLTHPLGKSARKFTSFSSLQRPYLALAFVRRQLYWQYPFKGKVQCNLEIILTSTSNSVWVYFRQMQMHRQVCIHTFCMMALGGNGVFLAHDRTAAVWVLGVWLTCSVASTTIAKSKSVLPTCWDVEAILRAVFHWKDIMQKFHMGTADLLPQQWLFLKMRISGYWERSHFKIKKSDLLLWKRRETEAA